MATRGPKLRSARNARPGSPGLIRHADLTPTSILSPIALAEFQRLVGVLGSKGTLDRTDLSVVTECSRIKALLDGAYEEAKTKCDREQVSAIGQLTSQRRGLLRELGLTLSPSRVHVRPGSGLDPANLDPTAAKIRLNPDTRKGG
jgi:hypothetical protein